MSTARRLTAALAASALTWVGLSFVVTTPGAQAYTDERDAPHDPATYYAGTEGLTGDALATQLNSIVDGNTQLTYAQVYDALPFTDEDPTNSANLIVFYSGTSLLKSSRCGAGSCAGLWNREHTWPQSHGDLTTGVGPGTDLFHMRPEFADTNSSRSNKDFDNGGTATVSSCAPCRSTANTFEPRAAVKGDLARGLMYMDVRFNGDASDGSYTTDLVLGQNVPTSGPHIGKLSTLVAWSLADPPDALERARNDMVDGTYQHNRNPFIDHPEWVCSIWGGSVPAGTCSVPANQSPTTSPMTTTTAEDAATTVALTGSDPDGDTLSWSITTPPTHGSATTSAGATLSYTPAANYFGTDTVGVTVSDGKGGTAATTVTITVAPVNDAPVATAQAASTTHDTAKVISLAGTDVDGDSLTYAIATQPAHGIVDLAGNQATYTPTNGHAGPDSFTFTVDDGTVGSAPATVSITVGAAGNQAPVATAQSFSTNEDTAKVVTLAGTDADGDVLTYAITEQPTHGTVNRTGNQATYTPAANYHGPDSFTFTASDTTSTSSSATVAITVTPVNDAPTVASTALSTTFGSPVTETLAASDVDGDQVTILSATSPTHGSVTFSGRTLTYTPTSAGPDATFVAVSDGNGGIATTSVGVTVAKAAAHLKLPGGSLQAGEPGTIKVKVPSAGGVAATGKVKLKFAGRTLTVTLKKGVAKFKIAQLPDATRLKVKAKYAGDGQYAAGSAKRTFTLS